MQFRYQCAESTSKSEWRRDRIKLPVAKHEIMLRGEEESEQAASEEDLQEITENFLRAQQLQMKASEMKSRELRRKSRKRVILQKHLRRSFI